MNNKEYRRTLRKNQTYAEKLLWSVPRNRSLNGHKFRRQHSIGNYFADFYCAGCNLVVEVDGVSHESSYRKKKDVERDDWMKSRGFNVLRFADLEVIEETDRVVNEIEKMCVNNPSPCPLPSRERERYERAFFLQGRGKDVRGISPFKREEKMRDGFLPAREREGAE